MRADLLLARLDSLHNVVFELVSRVFNLEGLVLDLPNCLHSSCDVSACSQQCSGPTLTADFKPPVVEGGSAPSFGGPSVEASAQRIKTFALLQASADRASRLQSRESQPSLRL